MAETVFSELLNGVRNGKHFNICLTEGTIKLGRKVYATFSTDFIKVDDLKYIDQEAYLFAKKQHYWELAEYLYEKYKFSSPTRETWGNKPYFKALSIDELDDKDIAYNENRNIAQAMLEGYIFCAAMQNWIKMDDDKWFYQGKDKDFVVLRQWIE